MGSLPLSVLAAALALGAGAGGFDPAQTRGWPRPDQRLKCGPLTVDVYVSRTAHLFHVVDQISAWDNACHGQYRRNMELSEEDEAMLRQHAAIRQNKRWGQGLEQTFYTPLDLDGAIREGKKAGHLTAEEAHELRAVMEYFAPRVDQLMQSRRGVLERAFERVDRETLTRAAEELARLTEVDSLVVPVFPLASPEPGGGGMDGGRLKWELSSEDDLAFGTLVHELTHAFVMQRNDDLRAVLERTPGLSMTLLGEGIAYAMAPGRYTDGRGDPLGRNVSGDRRGGEGWNDGGYPQQRLFGLAVRPLLDETLQEGESLEELLPRVRDLFLALREIHDEWHGPTLLTAGPAWKEVRARFEGTAFSLSANAFNHQREHYDQALPTADSDDLLVLLVAGDHGDRPIPERYAELSPVAPAEVEKAVRRGKTLARSHVVERPRGLRVVLLAAPTLEELRALVRKTPELDRSLAGG